MSTKQIPTREVKVGDRTAFGDEIIATNRNGDRLLVRIRKAKSGKEFTTDWCYRGTVFLQAHESSHGQS